MEVLSLGLKFDIGEDRMDYAEYVSKNYRWKDNDASKGFNQGVLACYKALAMENRSAIPRRHREALADLSRDESIVITQADKGGGVIVMDKNDYINKMMDLLNDATTYEKKDIGYAISEARTFDKEVRKILRKSERGKKLINLLEESPCPPRMRGLPKVHKPNIPMRPITSGIGSAPHRLAKRLAKPLSCALGSISNAHLKNSTDLIGRMKNVDLKNKKLASFDVKALFTNVPVDGALRAVEKAINNINDEDLPVPRCDYMKLVSMCIRFGAFVFNDQEYKQHRGLAMGSPLSAVCAALFMEMLEMDDFIRIIGRGASWFRYMDDILVVVPKETNLENKLRMLNNVHSDIQFTLEEEIDNKLPFLDTVIWRFDQGAKFSVYRKPTNRDDFIHYLSAHSKRTKSGVVIGFFLRAMRICSEEYLEEEIRYIVEAFRKLCYPVGWIMKLKRKAVEIKEKENRNNTREEKSYLIVPNSTKAEVLDKFMNKTNINIATSSGKKIGDVVRVKKEGNINKDSVIYSVPCSGCSSVYYGETYRGLGKRLAEHKNDVKYHRVSNSLVVHIDNHGHLPEWQGAKVLHRGIDKFMRRAMEAAHICRNREGSTNHREGFVCWANAAADLAVATWRRGGSGRVDSSQSGDSSARQPVR